MKRNWLIGAGVVALSLAVSAASAQDWQRTSGTDTGWIAKWLALDNVIDTGGFAVSTTHDYISEGTGGAASYETVSTQSGIAATQNMTVALPANGGNLNWAVSELDTNDGDNMATSQGMVATSDNFTWHGIIILASPAARTTTMNPAHDDHAEIWINGEKVYDNSEWTGGVRLVTTPTEVNLQKGGNVLLYKCGESGGSAYANLSFTDADDDLQILPTNNDQFFQWLSSVSVDPAGKLPTSWATMKTLR